MLASPSILPYSEYNPAYSPGESLESEHTTPRMSDADEALAAPMRRKLDRLSRRTERQRNQLSYQKDKGAPATSDWSMLQESQEQLELDKAEYDRVYDDLCDIETNLTAINNDGKAADVFYLHIRSARLDCKLLMSENTIYSTTQALEMTIAGLNKAFDAAPDKIHATAIDVVVTRSKDLEEELLSSILPDDHELRLRANAVMEASYLVQARTSKEPVVDTKPTVMATSSRPGIKIKNMDIPEFSGKTEDWLPFWRLFNKAIHINKDLDDEMRLTYLIQGLKDPTSKATYSERMEEDGAYASILAELQEEHDKPRWMHRRYCESMKNLATNPHTREGIKDLIKQVTTILKGFIRLKAENCRQILTSMTEAVIDSQMRSLWNQRTDKRKDTPPIEDLLLFMKEQADQLEEESVPPPKLRYEKTSRPPTPRYRGSTNSVVTLLLLQVQSLFHGEQVILNLQGRLIHPATKAVPCAKINIHYSTALSLRVTQLHRGRNMSLQTSSASTA